MFKNKEFYNGSIQKYTALVGVLFKNLKYVSYDSSGTKVFKDVHVFYGQNFKSRKDVFDYLNNRKEISRQLPILTFYLSAMNYAGNRNRNPLNKTICDGNEVYSPIPYDFVFQFELIAKNNESGYSIIEQILPYFSPAMVLSQKDLTGTGINYDISLGLTAPAISSTTDIPQNKLFEFVSSFTLTLKGNLYKPVNVSTESIIETININFKDKTSEEIIESMSITTEEV